MFNGYLDIFICEAHIQDFCRFILPIGLTIFKKHMCKLYDTEYQYLPFGFSDNHHSNRYEVIAHRGMRTQKLTYTCSQLIIDRVSPKYKEIIVSLVNCVGEKGYSYDGQPSCTVDIFNLYVKSLR